MRPITLLRRKQKEKPATPKPLAKRPKKHRDLSLPRNSGPPFQGGDLFAKFPYEIRRMIYIYVLGDQIIHLDRPHGKPRIAHYRCERQRDDGGYHPHYEAGKHGQTGLLKTCRAIYNEASEILYTTNTFSVQTCPNLETFLCFTRRIRPNRLAAIAAVYINMPAECFAPFWTDMSPGSRFWDFIRDWSRVWETMATQMPGLRSLRVQLRRTAQQLGLTIDEDWIRPMLRVRGLRRFELVLDGNGEYHEWTAAYRQQLRELQRFLGRLLCGERTVGEEYPEASTCWKRQVPCEDGICCKRGGI